MRSQCQLYLFIMGPAMEKIENSLDLLELDGYGYPTEEALEQIAQYSGDHTELMSQISFLLKEYGYCRLEESSNIWSVATGGWSGNESVIMALKSNRLFWRTCWYLTKRGGYYEFEITG